MNAIFLLFYGIALLIIFGGGVLVYLWLRRYHRLLGILAGLLSSTVLVLIWPIPVHGGFTFLGAILYDELQDELTRVEVELEQRKNQRFLQGLELRFAGVLDYGSIVQLAGSWFEVTLSTGEVAWLDRESGLIWSKPLPLIHASPLEALEPAKALCHELSPVGYWSLPTEAERYQFWRAAGQQYLPHRLAPAMGYMVNEDMGVELPSVSLPAAGSGNNTVPASTTLMLRCVARGPTSPARGYIHSDIPLAEWNRYQLARISGQ